MVRFSKGGHPELSKVRRRLGLVLRSSPPQSQGEVRAGGRLMYDSHACSVLVSRGSLEVPSDVPISMSRRGWWSGSRRTTGSCVSSIECVKLWSES